MCDEPVVVGPFVFRNATIVPVADGHAVRALRGPSKHGRLVGIVDESGRLIVREGGEILLIVEVKQA